MSELKKKSPVILGVIGKNKVLNLLIFKPSLDLIHYHTINKYWKTMKIMQNIYSFKIVYSLVPYIERIYVYVWKYIYEYEYILKESIRMNYSNFCELFWLHFTFVFIKSWVLFKLGTSFR